MINKLKSWRREVALNSKVSVLLYCLLIAGTIFYATAAHLYFGSFTANIAIRGWSAIDFSNWFLHQSLYLHDYPGGARSIGNSLIPYIYPLLDLYFDVNPEDTLVAMVFGEVVVFSFGVLFIVKRIFSKIVLSFLVILIAVFLLSNSLLPNLARFGHPFFHGQFYGYADGLRLVAIALYFSSAYFLSALLIFFAFVIHPIKALFALLFIMSAHLVCLGERKRFFEIKFVSSFSMLAAFSGAWAYFWLGNGVFGGIDDADFFRYAPIFNAHWFPQDLGIIDSKNSQYLTPYLSAIILALLSLVRSDISIELRRKLVAGLVALTFVSAFGLVVAWFGLSSSLVKLSLQRASMLALTFALVITIGQMFNDLRNRRFVLVGLTVSTLVVSFVSRETWPLTTSILILWLTWDVKNEASTLLKMTAATLLCLIIYQIYCFNKGYTSYSTFIYWIQASVGGLLFGLSLSAFSRLGDRFSQTFIGRLSEGAIVGLVVVMAVYWGADRRALPDKYVVRGDAYKEAQLWARDNTNPTSLFVVDPCIVYGWRDFSHRSSFGSPQEWLKTGWLYNGDPVAFEVGLERAFLYVRNQDDPMYKALNEGKKVNPRKLCKHTQSIFYAHDARFLKNLNSSHDVEYAVFDKSQLKKYIQSEELKFPIVFSNSHFLILDIKEAINE